MNNTIGSGTPYLYFLKLETQRTKQVLRAATMWLQDTHAEKADEILQALDHGSVTDELVAWAETVIAQEADDDES